MNPKKSRIALAVSAAVLASAMVAACGGDGSREPENVRMTWFGITNWHYQIGDAGILLDGETISDFAADPKPERRLGEEGVGHASGRRATSMSSSWATNTATTACRCPNGPS